MFKKVSILYRDAEKELSLRSGMPEFIKDLEFGRIIDVMCEGSKDNIIRQVIVSVLTELCRSADDIDYRYDVLQDFLNIPALLSEMQYVLSQLYSIGKDRQASIRIKNRVSAEYKLAKDIGVFTEYCKVFKNLADVLSRHKAMYTSEGLKRLCVSVSDYAVSGNFIELEKMLLNLKQCLKGYMRMKLKVQMNTSFKLTEAVLLDIDSNGFGSDCIDKQKYTCGFWTRSLKKVFNLDNSDSDTYIVSHVDFIVEQNVKEIKDKVLTSVSTILEIAASTIASFLKKLSEELLYYEGAMRLVNKVHSLGLEVTRALIAPVEERSVQIEGIYDLSFALYLSGTGCKKLTEVIVPNDVYFNDTGRIQIITGPNQGGKTTYIRSIGILQVLAQAGIPVPAKKAVISPVDGIFTHFPADEKPGSNEGRLGEELDRMLFILERATPKSLILMNESLASTNSREGSLIAQDIMSAIAVIGARCAFVTHMYEFAGRVDTLNEDIQRVKKESNRLISMTAQFQECHGNSDGYDEASIRKRTYRILPGLPAKSSFAADIAKQFNINYRNRAQGTL